MKKPPYPIVFYLFLLAGTAVLFVEATRIRGVGTLSGAATFPLFAAALMAVCLLALIVQELRARRAASRLAEADDEAPESLGQRLHRIVTLPMIGYMVVCAVYVAALEHVGFWIASAVFLFVSFLALHRKGLPRAAVATAAALVFVYVVFRYIFQVYLP